MLIVLSSTWSNREGAGFVPGNAENPPRTTTASDFPAAAGLVTRLYDEFGFDTVNLGPLSETWRVERDRPSHVVRQDAAEPAGSLAKAPRTV